MITSIDRTQKPDRLKKRSDFLYSQKHGRKWTAKGLTLIVSENKELEGQRFGVVVTKRLRKKAVDRNRVKRRLRAVATEILPAHAPYSMDYVLIGRDDTQTRMYADLKNDLIWCLKKLKLYRDENAADNTD